MSSQVILGFAPVFRVSWVAILISSFVPCLCLAQNCDLNQLEKIRIKFEELSKGEKCLSPIPQNHAARADCFAKTPPPLSTMKEVRAVVDDYSLIVHSCNKDSYRQTWVDLLQRMSANCDTLNSRSEFGNVLRVSRMPETIARAGVQCLYEDVRAREENRQVVVQFIRELIGMTRIRDNRSLRKNLLASMLDTFSFLAINDGFRHKNETALARAVEGDVSGSDWDFFLSQLSDLFPERRSEFKFNPVDLALTARQFKLANGLLKQR